MSRESMLDEASFQLGKFYAGLKLLRKGPTSPNAVGGDKLRSADQCEADIAHWREQGLADSDLLNNYEFNGHPKERDNQVPMSEMKAICKEYRPLYERYKVALDLLNAEGAFDRLSKYIKPDDAMVTSNTVEEYENITDPQALAKTLAAARKLDAAMKVGSSQVSLDEFANTVVTPLGKLAPKWLADARAAVTARNAKLAAPFAAQGIAGKKLELMVYYSEVYWRVPGGGRTDDPKKLAKADVLFQWLQREDPDDSRYYLNTIRRYQFDGNDLEAVTEKQYRRPKEASLDDTFK